MHVAVPLLFHTRRMPSWPVMAQLQTTLLTPRVLYFASLFCPICLIFYLFTLIIFGEEYKSRRPSLRSFPQPHVT